MRRTPVILAIVLAVGVLVAGLATAQEESVIRSVIESQTTLKPLALPSVQVSNLSMDGAYHIQRAVAKALQEKGYSIAGFKASLTCWERQAKFHADGPLFAPLFKRGRLEPGAVVNHNDFVNLTIKIELGFVAGHRIDRPVKDVAALRKKMKAVFPAINLVNDPFAGMKNVKSLDLIAGLAGSAKFIVGKMVPVPQVDLDQVGSCLEGLGGEADPIELSIPLYRDGKVVSEGKCTDALGGQCKALLWLVNAVIKRGWTIEPGHIFLTGPLGCPVPGKPGRYKAGYGALGAVSFTVK